MKKHLSFILFIIALFPAPDTTLAEEKEKSLPQLSAYDTCLLKAAKEGADGLLLQEIRKQCEKFAVNRDVEKTPIELEELEEERPLSKRTQSDKENAHKPFIFMAHNKNYLLFGSWNSHLWDSDIYHNTNGEEQLDLQQTEVQFQLSVKTPLMTDILGSKLDAYAAYTGRSFWQAYNTSESSPFRETNHEPEIWLQRKSGLHIGSLKNIVNAIGISHQSNGQGGELSRSWNRLYGRFAFEYGNFGLILNPWLRFEESKEDDNNPDIGDYLGHAQIIAGYTKGEQVFSLMSRNNLESGFKRGALEFGWSFPFWKYNYLRGYIQYFTGYGESMIDYDNYVNRIGAGLIITDIF